MAIIVMEVGRKNDADKVRWQFLPWAEVEEVAKVTDYGSRKYDANNWQRVPDARNRYFNASMRHITAWFKGEVLDPETGYPHLAHAISSLLFLMWHDKKEMSK